MAGPNNACFPKYHPSFALDTELIPENNRTEMIFDDIKENEHPYVHSNAIGIAVALYPNHQCEFVEVPLLCNNFSRVGDTYVCQPGSPPGSTSPFNGNKEIKIQSPVTFDDSGPGVMISVKDRFSQTYNPYLPARYFLSNEYIRSQIQQWIGAQQLTPKYEWSSPDIPVASAIPQKGEKK